MLIWMMDDEDRRALRINWTILKMCIKQLNVNQATDWILHTSNISARHQRISFSSEGKEEWGTNRRRGRVKQENMRERIIISPHLQSDL